MLSYEGFVKNFLQSLIEKLLAPGIKSIQPI